MKVMKILLMLVMAGSMFFTTQAYSVEVLVDPEPVLVPEGMELNKIAEGIKRGMSRRGWQVGKEEPGKIVAVLSIRNNKHIVKETITYNKQHVQIKYLDSYNMDYQMGTPGSSMEDEYGFNNSRHSGNSDVPVPMIHRKYNSWVKNLAADIKQELFFQN